MQKYVSFLAASCIYSLVLMSPNTLASEKTQVLMGEKTVTLEGKRPKLSQMAPGFKVVDEHFTPVMLSDFKGKTVLISAVPSLDTGVCALQTKRFNSEVGHFSDDVIMLTISTDLPFAQKRFCKVENVDKIKVLSDSVWRDFGEKYGLLIQDYGLLARAIFIIDAEGKLQYQELVPNITEHPNYDAALEALKTLQAQQ
ncbi:MULTISPECIES: thiol peroxidase [Shewanella]|jgi:thiol peroxidase|uniref:Thiol peroxidase n=2 Tax=Shewanella oncorhynchi TaxID=2726434 RepID=A0AA50KGT5_9GAMM|nr:MULTISPECIES: thiol peroxidase [Shewanella]RBP81560.1 thiol peroxidase (atypical 2-Cys peroxiredoxin) [Shewanella putrefaciens]GCF90486.1 2-Cys peroxiredoxin [Shewanella sp. M-Br]AVI67068.1 lipid hydroperoxide peroxidase [Shewanella sp. WE21]MBI1674526.1 thiol peroxidase [Shewanella sp. DW31]MBP6520849.1 thiol peroxidase [Shewanella sp.]